MSRSITVYSSSLLGAIFCALTLLVGCQEEHPACKIWVMRCLHGYQSGPRCKWFAHLMQLPPHQLLLHYNPEWF